MRFVCLAPDCDFTATVVYDAAAHSYAYGTDHTTTDGAPMTTYTATIRFETEIADGTAYLRLDTGMPSAIFDAWANDLNSGRDPSLPRWRPM